MTPLGRRFSTRRRLTVGMVLLVGAGLLISGAATYVALSAFVTHRLDQTLIVTRRSVGAVLSSGAHRDRRASHTAGVSWVRDSVERVLPDGGFAEIVPKSGAPVILQAPPTKRTPARASPPPTTFKPLPPGMVRSLSSPGAVSDASPTTLQLAEGRYRLVASPLRDGSGIVLVGLPLADTTTTLRHLLSIEAVVGAAALLLLAVTTQAVIRRDLRPLESIAETATAIAAGDRHLRVDLPEDTTEVGRLARSLNHMLEQNAEAFAAREASEAMLRRFVADASHELRTPLASIRGYAEVLESGVATGPDSKLAVTRIGSEATRMTRLVEDLLLLARLDQGRALHLTTVQLDRIAADAVADLAAADPGCRVAVDVEPVAVIGDEDQLREVFANLLSNATSHNPPGTSVWVSVAVDGADAVVAVRDDGDGLTEEQLARAFDRFYRSESARSRRGGRTPSAGLGLSIVAAIAAAHGGAVAVESRRGEGSCFTLRLPRRGPHVQVASPAPPCRERGREPVSRTKLRNS